MFNPRSRLDGLAHAVLGLAVVMTLGVCLFSVMNFAGGVKQAGEAANRTGRLLVQVERETKPTAQAATANKPTVAPHVEVAVVSRPKE